MPEFDSTIEYRDIPDFPGHKAGSDGTIWSKKSFGWIRRKCDAGKLGHLRVEIKGSRYLVHRLVLEVFVGPCPEGMECRHFPDPSPRNNFLNNIQWATHSINMQDKRFHGTCKIKVTDQLAEQIRAEHATGKFTFTALGRKYGLSLTTTSKIVRRIYQPLEKKAGAVAVAGSPSTGLGSAARPALV